MLKEGDADDDDDDDDRIVWPKLLLERSTEAFNANSNGHYWSVQVALLAIPIQMAGIFWVQSFPLLAGACYHDAFNKKLEAKFLNEIQPDHVTDYGIFFFLFGEYFLKYFLFKNLLKIYF
jgi:hypothetical protein